MYIDDNHEETLSVKKWEDSTFMGDVAALARSHMNGSLPFEKTIEQTI